MQTPLEQLCVGHPDPVHPASSHRVPSAAGADVQPVVESHESTVQGFESSQLTGVLAQAPVEGSQ
jgi:hypothetical protein